MKHHPSRIHAHSFSSVSSSPNTGNVSGSGFSEKRPLKRPAVAEKKQYPKLHISSTNPVGNRRAVHRDVEHEGAEACVTVNDGVVP